MKTVLMIFAGLLLTVGAARAENPYEIKNCVGVMMGNSKMTQEKAEYACNNPWLDHRDSDTAEQESMRQELKQDQEDAREEMLREGNLPALSPDRL